jgi:diguanylate cyclase (GGDEF)-like protein
MKALLPVLGKITRAVSSDRPLEAILKSVARDVARLLASDTCSVMLINDKHRELLFAEAHGLTKKEIAAIRFRMGEGVAGWVALHRKPALLGDVRRDPRFKAFAEQETKITSLLCVPLLLQGRVLGVLSVSSARRKAFAADDRTVLEHIGGHLALEIENHRLYELAVTDGLTGLFNRRYFLRRLEDEIGRARRFHEMLAVCIADLDDFKKVNDKHGHAAGDEVLVGVAQIFRRQLRAYDVAARYGGDEFAFLFLNTDRGTVDPIAKRLRDALDRDIATAAGEFRVTVSIGRAVYPEDGVDAKTLLGVADGKLYDAKRSR